MAIIQDAASGVTARVDDSKQLRTFSVIQRQEQRANLDGLYYSIYFQFTPSGANSVFFYLKNTGIFDVQVNEIRVFSSAATQILINKVSGTPSYSGSLTPTTTNRNLGSNLAPSVEARHDASISGLTNQGTLFNLSCDTVNREVKIDQRGSILIPQGQALALQRVASSGQITCTVSLSREVDE